MRVLWMGLALVVPALAGCFGASSTSGAMPLLSAAQDAAEGWQADAMLQGVAAYEVINGTQLVEERANNQSATMERAALAHNDAQPADGMAPAWQFSFISAEANASYQVVIDASGHVLEQGPGRAMVAVGSEALDLEHWKIDADEAWQLAKDHDAGLARTLENGSYASYDILFHWPMLPHPVWLLGAQRTYEDNEGQAVLVDASNGTVGDFGGLLNATLRGLLPVFQEWGSTPMTLTPLESDMEWEFEVADGRHGILGVALAFSAETPPGQKVALRVLQPDGKVALWLNHTRGTPLFDGPAFGSLLAPGAGNYTVEAAMEPLGPAGLAANIEVSWCTDGEALAFPGFLPVACGLLPGGSLAQTPNARHPVRAL